MSPEHGGQRRPVPDLMLIFRWMIPTLLVLAGVLFAAFMLTGDPRYKRHGLRVLIATLIAAFAFFAGLIVIDLTQ